MNRITVPNSQAGWQRFRNAWAPRWRDLYARAQAEFAANVEADPHRYEAGVKAYAALLVSWGKLVRIRMWRAVLAVKDPELQQQALAQYMAADKRWLAMAAGFHAEVHPERREDRTHLLDRLVLVFLLRRRVEFDAFGDGLADQEMLFI